MERTLEQAVQARANFRCEYCQLDQSHTPIPHEVDHVLARKHGGETVAENLALSCSYCNRYKGPNIAGVDPVSGTITRLYHPRKDRWRVHFAWDGPILTGRTRIGRTTVQVLEINRPERVLLRNAIMRADS